ncbi:unnamed protein product [Caenorhabditis nigoni]
MPELVLEKIIEFSDFKAVLTLRHVCRDFRNFIDDLNDSKLPDSKFAKIGIFTEKDDSKIIMDFLHPDYRFDRLEYSEMENSRNFKGKITILENENIVDVAIRDLQLILKFQKSNFGRSYFYFADFRLQNDSTFYHLPTKLSNMLNVFGRKIKTVQLSIRMFNKSNIMTVSPFADPDTLKILDLSSSNGSMEIEIDEVAKTEQWKKAETLKCCFRLLNMNVEYISHFLSIDLKVDSIRARDLDFLKKTFINSSKFKHAFFDLIFFNENEEISDLWGPAFDSQLAIIWYFGIKDSKDEDLRIEILYYNMIPRL